MKGNVASVAFHAFPRLQETGSPQTTRHGGIFFQDFAAHVRGKGLHLPA